jgi:hypothetical protein
MKIQFMYVRLTRMSAFVPQRILRTLSQVIILATLSTGIVAAETLSDYCLVKQDKTENRFLPMKDSFQYIKPTIKYCGNRDNKIPLLSVTVRGEVFHIGAGRKYLWITDEHNKETLSKTPVPQVGDNAGICDLVSLGDNWLWINGTQNYIAKLDVSKLPPVIETPKRISDLTYEPVYRTFSNWLDGKITLAPGTARGYYSPRLNRVFVTGYHLGSDEMESLEVVDGQVRRLPEPLQGADVYYYMDSYQYLAKLNGDLFVGRQGEAFFYDGSHVTTLLDIPDEEKEKKTVWDKFSALFNSTTKKKKDIHWVHKIIPSSQRIFLAGTLGTQPFFAELKQTDSPLTPVFLDDGIISFPDSGLYQFPDEKQLLVITEHGVLAETPKGMVTLIKASKPSWFTENRDREQINPLSTFNNITRKFTDYQLVRASDSANCIATLNPNKPIVLDNP